jgi:type I restriction enzyme S subunit
MTDQNASLPPDRINLGDIASFEMGQSPDSRYVSDSPSGIPFLQGNAEFGAVHPQPRLWCRQPKKVCQPGDSLISVRAPVGALNHADQAYCIGRGLAAVRFFGANPRYGAHLLAHFAPGLRRKAQGTTFEAVGKDDLASLEVNQFSDAEQIRIALVLNTLEEMIGKTMLVIEKRQGVVKGLVQQLFERWEAADGLPLGWRVSRIGDLCDRITDGTHQAVKTTEEGIPFLFVSCIRDGLIHWDQAARIPQRTYERISPGRVPTQDAVLYTAVGSYGHAALTETSRPFGFQRHIAILYPCVGKLVPSFLAEWFNSEAGRRVADRVAIGNAQKTVTLGALGSFPIPIPNNPSEQESLVAPIRAARDGINQLEFELRKLRAIKSGLSSDLLTGRVGVSLGSSPR